MLPLGSISSSHPIPWGGIGEIWIATPPMVSAGTEREREETAAQPCVVHESLSSFPSKLAFAVCPFSQRVDHSPKKEEERQSQTLYKPTIDLSSF